MRLPLVFAFVASASLCESLTLSGGRSLYSVTRFSAEEQELRGWAALEAGASTAPFDFVPNPELFAACQEVFVDLEDGTDNPDMVAGVCAGKLSGLAKKAGADDATLKKGCAFLGEQAWLATVKGTYGKFGRGLCGKIVQFDSFASQADMMSYFSPQEKRKRCTNAVTAAGGEKKKNRDAKTALQMNLPTTCKSELEEALGKQKQPVTVAQSACREFMKKAEAEIMGGSLSAKDGGDSFCKGKTPSGDPLSQSEVAPVPNSFPLTPGSWMPVVTLENLAAMLLHMYGGTIAAFRGFDADGNGHLEAAEWNNICAQLEIPYMNCKDLHKEIDANADGKLSFVEFQNAIGVSLDELRVLLLDKWMNADKGFKAGDKDASGGISPKEFQAHCKEVEVTVQNADSRFPEVDTTPPDGEISKEEYTNAFGITLEELKMRIRKIYGSPAKAFEAWDKDGNDKLTEEEWLTGMGEVDVPARRGMELFDEVDTDKSGDISMEEFYKAMELDMDELRRQLMKSLGKGPAEIMESLDADGDGDVTKEELVESMKDAGITEEDAERLVKEIDSDGDGTISEKDWARVTGEEELDEKRFTKPSPQEKLEKDVSDLRYGRERTVTLEDAVDRFKKAYGTTKEVWEEITGGEGKKGEEMTMEQWKKACEKMGIPPGQAEKLFREMDKDGTGKVSWDEFQDAFGITEEGIRQRVLEEFGNADDAFAKADLDGDGYVDEEELRKLLEEMGVPPDQAKKLAKELMKKYGGEDGKMSKEEFNRAMGAREEDLAKRMRKKFKSAKDAMHKWDKDGDGIISEEEFVKGAKELGISEQAARRMFRKADKDGSGGLDAKEFLDAFAVGPDELLERCFQYMTDPETCFRTLDADRNHLIRKDEWMAGVVGTMKFAKQQAEMLFDQCDTNEGERTPEMVSQWEFFKFLDYDPPSQPTWGDGFGDIDPWGRTHKKFNKLTHTTLQSQVPGLPIGFFVGQGNQSSRNASNDTGITRNGTVVSPAFSRPPLVEQTRTWSSNESTRPVQLKVAEKSGESSNLTTAAREVVGWAMKQKKRDGQKDHYAVENPKKSPSSFMAVR